MRTKSYFDIRHACNAVLALLFMFGSVGFVSCSSDDEDGDDGGSTVLPDYDMTNKVTAIYDSEDEMVFNYENGVMTSGQYVFGGNFTISPTEVTFVEGDGDQLYKEIFKIKDKNSFGSVTSADVEVSDATYGELYEYEGTFNASYDKDNHIQSLNVVVLGNGESESIKLTFTWVGGNLARSSYRYFVNYYDGEKYEETDSYSYEYGSDAVNNNGICIPGFLKGMEYFGYAGLLGSMTDKIPTSVNGEAVTVELDLLNRVFELFVGGEKFATYYYYDEPEYAPQAPRKSESAVHKRGLMRHLMSALTAK